MISSPAIRHPMSSSVQRFRDAAGGPAGSRVVFLLACVLALDTALGIRVLSRPTRRQLGDKHEPTWVRGQRQRRLQSAFLILLVTMAISGPLTFVARRTYQVDVATAVASEGAWAERS